MSGLLTSAERLPRGAVVVGAALLLLLLVDLRAVDHLRAARPRCVEGALPPVSSLEVSLRVQTPVLRAGDDAPGQATVTNRSARPVVLLRADVVLAGAGTGAAVSRLGSRPFRAVELAPGTFATIPFVVHLARCRRGGAALAPGFYEVVLLLVEEQGSVVRVRRSAGQAVVLSP
jgi:hypothetical protein